MSVGVFSCCVDVTEGECCLYECNSWFYSYSAGVGVAVSQGSFRRLMREEWHNSGLCLMFLSYRLKKISKVGKFGKGCKRDHFHYRKRGKTDYNHPFQSVRCSLIDLDVIIGLSLVFAIIRTHERMSMTSSQLE